MAPGKGRPHSQETKLGRMIAKRGLAVYVVGGQAEISSRLMTEYLAGRRVIRANHAQALARVLDCAPDDIIGDSQEDVTDATGVPLNGARSVKDLQRTHAPLIRRRG